MLLIIVNLFVEHVLILYKYCHPCCGTNRSPSLILLMCPSSSDKSCVKYQNSPSSLDDIYQFIFILFVTSVDNKSVLSVHMFIDNTISIMRIDIPQNLVLSHAVRIHLCCWSLTADSHSLDWTGHVIQDKVQSEIGQGGQCQNNHGTKDDNNRSKNWFPQTC